MVASAPPQYMVIPLIPTQVPPLALAAGDPAPAGPYMLALAAWLGNINGRLSMIAHEMSLISNVPDTPEGAHLINQIDQIRPQLMAIIQVVTALIHILRVLIPSPNEITDAVNTLMASVMRAENAAAWRTGVLRGPNGYLPAPITTRDQLLEATGGELDALEAHLGGVQDYPAGGSVPARRGALAAYLGVVL